MKKNDETISVVRPFGPSIARVKMPNDLVEKLNEYIEEIISSKKKSEELYNGDKLAGHVTQEFKLEEEFIISSGFQKFLASSVLNWIKLSENKEIKEFQEAVSSCLVWCAHNSKFDLSYLRQTQNLPIML